MLASLLAYTSVRLSIKYSEAHKNQKKRSTSPKDFKKAMHVTHILNDKTNNYSNYDKYIKESSEKVGIYNIRWIISGKR